ncbi:MAG: DUF1329 domain-containing protein [Proteobacteria bacterium]|nr:DUF1329 domain-containing protein [Pseudomonadota bacterium]
MSIVKYLSIVLLFLFLGGTIYFNNARAGVSVPEALQLGTSLTPFGAEKAGNRDGTIPPYTGGLTETDIPADFKKGSGRWTDPFPKEKPLYSISSRNMAKYDKKLSEASKALLRKYPSYRMDIYPSHRSVAYPSCVLENSRKNATRARLINGGLTVDGAIGGVPFPIVKNGNEAMWNHLLRYNGHAVKMRASTWFVTTKGVAINSADINAHWQNPYYNPQWTLADLKKNGNYYDQAAYNFIGPPQAFGNASLTTDSLDPVKQPRRVWTYSAASRRIRIAPDFAYDTPVASVGGVVTYDERTLFIGKLDMFDFKLLGKREMFIPYNNYNLLFQATSSQFLTPRHINPDFVRWELHRVWVVEANLKKGQRHVIGRRVYYFDEDWGGGGMCDAYNNMGQLVKGLFNMFTQLYDIQTPNARNYWAYDLMSGIYSFSLHLGDPGMGLWPQPEGFPNLLFTPDALPNRMR